MPERLFSYCVLLDISLLSAKMFESSSLCRQNEKVFFLMEDDVFTVGAMTDMVPGV